VIEIKFNTTNAAFGDSPEQEISRILRGLADKIAEMDLGFDPDPSHHHAVVFAALRDISGNEVGTAVYTQDDYFEGE
jgi:hypothetical protein